ncbi:hypothetical protein RRG08_012269 [Elysia crispata]|uniref:Uncharacterized protein n=1 Tax=Elysia crispata TaxID=231223 RepID=A0AAE1ECP6_9GAST|nr:hypothetical protein RRG08_012269 [Elysia crispata]
MEDSFIDCSIKVTFDLFSKPARLEQARIKKGTTRDSNPRQMNGNVSNPGLIYTEKSASSSQMNGSGQQQLGSSSEVEGEGKEKMKLE